ncbi:MAG TPA: hypothetical protein VLB76_21435 [Thermoanaerobaculia bacterium]|jgi:hypothetical protein|nr:hypothetical protein [Thermoanaerobaculia bacterium]
MKTKNWLIVSVIFLSLSAASERTYMGYPVVDMKFPIAGGKAVSLPVTEAGPIPAEDRAFKIEAAGISIQPLLFSPKRATLAWQFALTAKSFETLEHVTVEEVYPDEVAKVLVDDQSPALKEKTWSGSSIGVEPDLKSTPWLFSEGDSIFVFRFTINSKGKPPAILYQPAWISQSAKRMSQLSVKQTNGS